MYKEIERDTERVAGGNKGISDLPIVLKIYGQKLINLSLVDLPGLTKVRIFLFRKHILTELRCL